MRIAYAMIALVMFSPSDKAHGSDVIQAAMESSIRLESDFERDASRQPDKVLEFFGIEPGMKVLDLFSGGGYYSAIVSGIVGEDGQVTSHNNQAYLDYAADDLTMREDKGVPENLVLLVSEANDLDLAEGEYDAILAVLTWHDFYYVEPGVGWPEIDVQHMIDQMCKGLKKGGILGIIDHVGEKDSDVREVAQTLHRIDPKRIKQDLKGSCFRYKGEADFLRNESDDYSLPMSAASVRGKTDRVVYRYKRK